MNNGDPILNLPVDGSVPSHNEMKIVETLFDVPPTKVQKIVNGTKNSLIRFGLFILFSSPLLDGLINKFIMETESIWTIIMIKAVLFVLADFIICNIYLVRRKD